MDYCFTIANFAKTYELFGTTICDFETLSIKKLQKIIRDFSAFNSTFKIELNEILKKFKSIIVDESIDLKVLAVIRKNFPSIRVLDLQIFEHNAEGLLSSVPIDKVFNSYHFNITNFLRFYSLSHDKKILIVNFLQSEFFTTKNSCSAIKAKIFLRDVLECFDSALFQGFEFPLILPEMIKLGKQFKFIDMSCFRISKSTDKKLIYQFLNSQTQIEELKIYDLSIEKEDEIQFSHWGTLRSFDFSRSVVAESHLVDMFDNLFNCSQILFPKMENKFLLELIFEKCDKLTSAGFTQPSCPQLYPYFAKWLKKMDGRIKNLKICHEENLEFYQPVKVFSVEKLTLINCKLPASVFIFDIIDVFPNLKSLILEGTELKDGENFLLRNSEKYKTIELNYKTLI